MNDTEPKSGLRGDHVAGLVLVLIALAVGWENRVYPLGTLSAPGPGSVPLMLAVLLGACGLVVLLRAAGSPLLTGIRWSEGRRGLLLLVACGVATFALERLGYRLTMIALLVFLLGAVERKSALATALVSLGFSLGSFYLFATLLKVQLPRGPWGL